MHFPGEILITSKATIMELEKTTCIASPMRPIAVATPVKLLCYPFYKAYTAPILRYAREVWTATWNTEDACCLKMASIAQVWGAVGRTTRDPKFKEMSPIKIQSLVEALAFFQWEIATPTTINSTIADNRYESDLDTTVDSPRLLERYLTEAYAQLHIQRINTHTSNTG